MSDAPDAVYLREAGERDIEAVMIIMDEAFDPAFGEAWTRAQCLGILSLPGISLVVAMTGDQPLGFSLVRTIGNEAELLLIAVRPRFRGRSIGENLLHAVLAAAAEAHVERLFLEVRDGNAALQLYRKMGFALIGKRRAYYQGRGGALFDAFTLSREIG